MRTARKEGLKTGLDALLEGVLGLNGESGECADIVKKNFFHGHPFDRQAFAKELGDVLWYVARSADAIGMSLDEIAKINIDKLYKRYPEGFDSIRSINRTE